jgi:hypothetical protein
MNFKTPRTITAKKVWNASGFDYCCVDVDQRPGTISVDLQSLQYPSELANRFDLVCNCGTTEHLANPVGGLMFAHFACKVGGYLFHDVPLFGLGNHGLCNPTPKFWIRTAKLNCYDIVCASVRPCKESEYAATNFYSNDFSNIDGLADISNISWLISLAFRKTGQAVFVPPFDAIIPRSDGAKEAALIVGSLSPAIATGLFTKEAVDAAIDSAMAAIGKPYRKSYIKRAAGIIPWVARGEIRRIRKLRE